MRPEQTKLALTLDGDGPVAIMAFVTRGFTPDGSVQFSRELTDATVRAECAKAGLSLISWRVLGEAEVPEDRSYRDSWVDRDGRIDHDMGKARDIYRARLRRLRAPMLEDLDVEYQRADEADDKERKKSIAAQKQRLRDATTDPRIEQCASIDALKGLDVLHSSA